MSPKLKPWRIRVVKVESLPVWYGLPFVLIGMEMGMVPGSFAMRLTVRPFMPVCSSEASSPN